MRRVMVTGCAGFIGSNLARALLAAGYQVVGVDDLSAGDRRNVPPGVDLRVTDIRGAQLEAAFAGVDAAFHLAAKNCLPECARDPIGTVETNVLGTVQVLEACRRHGVQRFVYADTSAVYEGIEPLPAGVDRVAPCGIYAAAKHAGAELVRSFARFHGLHASVLRYFNVYGPAQDHRRAVPPLMSAVAMQLMQGKPPVIHGSGQQRRDFVYVDDVNRFHLQCLADPRTVGGTFDLGTGRSASVLEVVDLIGETLGVAIAPRFAPGQPGEARETLADVRPAAALGWRADTPLAVGLRRSIEDLRHRLGTGCGDAAGGGET